MMSEAISTEEAVEITRTFNAPINTVYKAFTEVEAVSQWGCGNSYENINLDMDVRPGGVIHHRVKSKGDDTLWTFFGVYQEVEKNRKLVYTFDWKTDWRESPTPSLVDIEFQSLGDTTEIQLSHTGIPGPGIPSTEKHWDEFLGVLEDFLRADTIN
jgi:uncharacterized protein YndB with AHSA1/START domain